MSSFVNSMVQTNNEFNQALSKQKGSALDKDAFMLLLVTQFKYQDPLNPAEDKEFIAQLAQFSSLEQLMNLNDSMEGLTAASLQGQMINATSYIGKTVDVTGDKVSKTTTDKDKNEFTISSFRYAIGETAVKGSIKVYDSDGSMVYSEDQPARAANTYTFDWDGKTFSGAYAPDGIYRIVPSFTNADGKSIQYDAVVDGKVSGVTTDSGVTYLSLEDGRNVALANVRRVGERKTTTGDKDDTGSGGSGDSGGSGGDDSSGGTGGTGGTEDTGGTGGTGDTGGTTPETGNSGGTGTESTPDATTGQAA